MGPLLILVTVENGTLRHLREQRNQVADFRPPVREYLLFNKKKYRRGTHTLDSFRKKARTRSFTGVRRNFETVKVLARPRSGFLTTDKLTILAVWYKSINSERKTPSVSNSWRDQTETGRLGRARLGLTLEPLLCRDAGQEADGRGGGGGQAHSRRVRPQRRPLRLRRGILRVCVYIYI